MKTFPFFLALAAYLTATTAIAATLQVGPGKKFTKIEAAVTAAKSGDEIVIYPLKNGAAYQQPALLVKTPKLTIRAAKKPVILDGTGFNYSGRGSTPRAIFQFDPGADGCVLDGLTLTNARNESNNGAGVRINQANDVTIRNCTIYGNDMGIMSNGDAAAKTGAGQVIEKCKIYENGTDKHPGYNHNLYLGGTSVTVRDCDIARAVTGHNLKSRAHKNFIINNHIHHSANRELDLVDAAGTTDIPDSDTLLVGNTIVKDPNCKGNRGVIHFGKDGGAEHDGFLAMKGNKISTPFATPIVLATSGRGVVFLGNTFDAGGKNRNGTLAELKVADMKAVGAENTCVGNFTYLTPTGQRNPLTAMKPSLDDPKNWQALVDKLGKSPEKPKKAAR